MSKDEITVVCPHCKHENILTGMLSWSWVISRKTKCESCEEWITGDNL